MHEIDSLIVGADGKTRCWWCGDDPLYVRYHDEEWGRPVHDDLRLFEKICLEGFQAGLSWITILRKREHFRAAFAGFDFEQVARFTEDDVERLLQDEGIIRHRGKIEATINNAQRALELVEEQGSLSAYFWSFEPSSSLRARSNAKGVVRYFKKANKSSICFARSNPGRNGLPRRSDDLLAMTIAPKTREDTPSQTPESKALSKDLKKRGWKFVGPTTCYAFMQAMGMVNDHIEGCLCR